LTVTRITPKDENGTVLRGLWSTPYILDPQDSNVLYGGYGRDFYKSDDRGDSWSNFTNGNVGFGNCEHIAIAPSDNKYIYLAKGGHQFYYSHDGGTSWGNTTINFAVRSLTYIAVNPDDPKELWVTLGHFVEGKKVYKSEDGGVTFTNVSGSLPNVPVNCIVYEKGSNDGVYIGTDIGVFYKNNALSDWQVYSDNLPTTIVTELEIQYLSDKLYAATFGRGVWVSDLYTSSNSNTDSDITSCITSNTANWTNTALDNQTSNFETTFSVKPNANNVDGVIGLSNSTVSAYTDMGVIIRFNKTGSIDVRNGSNYQSAITIAYAAGDTFNFRVAVNFENKKYSVYTSRNGAAEQLLADGFDFRTEQATLANINNWAVLSGAGVLEVCNFEITNTNKLPVVVMTSPANNATFEAGSTITLSSDASDPDGTVVRVTWFQNGVRIRSDSGDPFSKPWIDVPAGTYDITATAEDNTGAIQTSDPVRIIVKSKAEPICNESTALFSGLPLEKSIEGDAFTVESEVKPRSNNMDGVIGLSNGRGNSYSDLAVIVRLNKEGTFDVRNGSSYSNSEVVNYVADTYYKIKIEGNLSTKKYSVYVTPRNGVEVKIADNYNFRTEQATIARLDNWNWISGVGNFKVCVDKLVIGGENDILPLPGASPQTSVESGEDVLANNFKVKMVPNPAAESVSLLFTGNHSDDVYVYIYDTMGKLVLEHKQTITNRELILNTSSLPNGMYFVKASIERVIVNNKLVINK